MPAAAKPPTIEIDPGVPDVLVVDDDVELRESLLEILQQHGFTAIGASNGAEGLRMARDRSPRLLLLDLEMPVLNGWQVLERRRRERRLAAIPVVVMSARSGDWVGDCGADAQLEKPLDVEQVAQTVGQLLAPRPETGTILIVDDDADTRAEVGGLLEDAGYRVACACNGRDGEALLREIPRPVCIIVDLWMPVMNGWSFINRLQRFGRRPVPIIVVTAAESDREYPVPLTHVLRKPFHPDNLLALVDRVVPPSDESKASQSEADEPAVRVPRAANRD